MKKKAIAFSCLFPAVLFTGCGSELGNRMAVAGLNTILGLCIVFCVLIIISLLISLFRYIQPIQDAITKKIEARKAEKNAQPIEEATPVAEPETVPETQAVDDLELVAVISAAIAAYTGTSADGFVVRSIRRR